jgi:CRISPR-associated exonuclease Cas4
MMAEGIRSHQEEGEREERRSLHTYGLKTGERTFHLALHSEQSGLTGCLDLAIVTPAKTDPHASAIVVEYKLSEQQAGPHFKLQLAAYAMLLEEAWHIPVTQSFLYSIPLRRAERIAVTSALRQKVKRTVTSIRQMVEHEIMPPPPSSQHRCATCEFRRFCNDVV